MFMLRSTCFQTPCHAYAQIYMFLCSLPGYAQIYMLLGSLHVFVQIHIPMYSLPCLCSMPCLCAQIYVGCYAMCYFSPFSTLISLFLVFCLTSNHIQTSHKRDERNHTSKWPQRLTSISPWRAQGMAKPRFRKANMDTKHRSKQAYTCIKEIIQTL